MGGRTTLTPRQAWFCGLATIVLGVVPIVHVTRWGTKPPDAPAWVVDCAGLAFVAAGMAIIAGYAMPDRRREGAVTGSARLQPSVFQYLLSLVITGAMTIIAGWIAFGPGERRFSTNIPFLPPAAGAIVGRVGFGIAAILMVGMFALFAIAGTGRRDA